MNLPRAEGEVTSSRARRSEEDDSKEVTLDGAWGVGSHPPSINFDAREEDDSKEVTLANAWGGFAPTLH